MLKLLVLWLKLLGSFSSNGMDFEFSFTPASTTSPLLPSSVAKCDGLRGYAARPPPSPPVVSFTPPPPSLPGLHHLAAAVWDGCEAALLVCLPLSYLLFLSHVHLPRSSLFTPVSPLLQSCIAASYSSSPASLSSSHPAHHCAVPAVPRRRDSSFSFSPCSLIITPQPLLPSAAAPAMIGGLPRCTLSPSSFFFSPLSLYVLFWRFNVAL